MSDFGDWEEPDALDHEPPDAEQVSMKLHGLLVVLDVVAGDLKIPTWDDLSDDERAMAMGIGAMIVTYIIEREPEDAEELARTLHNARRYMASSRLPAWDNLSADDRQVGIDLMAVILGWLARQGALDAA